MNTSFYFFNLCSFSFISNSWIWITNHWILALLILIAFLVVVFFVILPLCFSFFQKYKKVQETKSLKKDLMIWSNLSNLVQGGKKGKSAKSELSAQLKLIKSLFIEGLQLIKENGQRKYSLPWFVMLGEPMSGKSLLMKNSRLDLVCSVAEEMGDPNKRQILPVRFWMGSQAVVLDVAGRVFFDRWMEGSSAEWHYLISLIKKYHHKKPLDGIILTIPADALLMDDEALTKQKASLIATEMKVLLKKIGLYVPVYLVVTKLDMISGFKEYFSVLDETQQMQIFGWRNPNSSGKFQKDIFDLYWSDLLDRLKNGMNHLLLNKNVLSQGGQRLNINGRIYLFPDYFNEINRNLTLYLTTIFGQDNYLCNVQAMLDGVFFTANDGHDVTFSPAVTTFCHKKIEDMPLRSIKERDSAKSSFFIHSLLHQLIFKNKDLSFFNVSEQIRRHIPHYILCTLLFLFGGTWIFSTLVVDDLFKKNLSISQKYYQDVTKKMKNNSIANSPLVGLTENGQFSLLNKHIMAEDPSYNRLQFFYDSKNKALESIHAPFGFYLSAICSFGLDFNLGKSQRYYIFDQIQNQMVFLPTLNAMQENLINKEDEPFTVTKSDALIEFMKIVFVANEQYREDHVDDYINMDYFFSYLFPYMGKDVKALLSTYYKNYDYSRDDVNAKIIYDFRFTQAQKSGVSQLFKHWHDLDIYPENIYPILRSLIVYCDQLNQTYYEINDFSSQFSPKTYFDDQQLLKKWYDLSKKQIEQSAKVEEFKRNLIQSGKWSFLSYPKLDKDKEKETEKTESKETLLAETANSTESLIFNPVYALEKATGEYKKIMDEDIKFILKYIEFYEIYGRLHYQHSPYGITQETAQTQIDLVKNKFLIETQSLTQKAQIIQKDDILGVSEIFNKEQIDSPNLLFNYQIVDKFVQLIKGLQIIEKSEKTTYLLNDWNISETHIKQTQDAFESLAKKFESSKKINEMSSAYRKILNFHIGYNRIYLAQKILDSWIQNANLYKKLASLDSFTSEWDLLNSQLETIQKDFENLKKAFTGKPYLEDVWGKKNTILTQLIISQKQKMIDALLNFYPNTALEFKSIISQQKNQENCFDISQDLANESIGPLTIVDGYNADIVSRYLSPFTKVVLLSVAKSDNKKGESNEVLDLSSFIRNHPRYATVSKMMQLYLDEYIQYWGYYTDRLALPINSWKSFRAACNKIKPYEVNTLLFMVYKKNIEFIQIVNDLLLTADTVKIKKTLLETLNGRLQILNPLFSEICIKQISSWGSLSVDSSNAFWLLKELGEKTLKEEYLAIIASGNKGDIPWWSHFIQTGISFLKNESSEQFVNSFRKNELDMLCFPICSDSLMNRVLSKNELKKIQEFLMVIGPSLSQPENAPQAVKENSKEDNSVINTIKTIDSGIKLSTKEKQWISNLQQIIDALINPKKPLVWKLTLPDIEMQQKLSDSLPTKLQLGAYRFRYLNVDLNQRNVASQIPTVVSSKSKELVLLASGEGDIPDLNFSFFSHSMNHAEDATLNFSNQWAIIRLYLQKNNYYDPESKLMYVPLIITDSMGGRYVLWVALQFNKVLPMPSDWPSLMNWMEFSDVQQNIKDKRQINTPLWSELMKKSSSDEFTYESVVNLLKKHDIESYPQMEISIVPDKIYLKYRYLEFVQSGKSSVWINTTTTRPQDYPRFNLADPQIEIRCYQYSDSKEADKTIVINGPYAPIRLLTSRNKKADHSFIYVKYPCDEKEELSFKIRLIDIFSKSK